MNDREYINFLVGIFYDFKKNTTKFNKFFHSSDEAKKSRFRESYQMLDQAITSFCHAVDLEIGSKTREEVLKDL